MIAGRHIVILGMGPSAMERKWDMVRGGYIPERAEVWTLNNAYVSYPHLLTRVNRWFELHSWDYLRTWKSDAERVGHADHFAALASLKCPVYVTEPLPRVTNAVRVDWHDVFRHHIDRGAANYFLGSPSLMMAVALYEHDHNPTVAQIDSWGIDTSDPQHGQQRQSWAYWIAQAHARKIETGGTSLGFMSEPEKDDGLRGLRERIGDRIEASRQAPGSADFIIATYCSDNEPHKSNAARLQADCQRLGLRFWCNHYPARPEGETWGESIKNGMGSKVSETVTQALDMFGVPVIYVDASDRVVCAPTLPNDFAVGYCANPESQHYGARALPVGIFSAFANNERSRDALRMMQPIEAAATSHRALCAIVAALGRWPNSGVVDVSPHFRGCFVQTPSRDRTTTCKT